MFLGLSGAYTVRVNMSIAIVAMTSDDDPSSPRDFEVIFVSNMTDRFVEASI